MTPAEANNREAQRQVLLGQLSAVEAALHANLDLDCASVAARVHMQRALAHIHEAAVPVNGVGHARTVCQFVEDLTKFRRNLDQLQQEPPAHPSIRPPH
jgi:hypothetical protein